MTLHDAVKERLPAIAAASEAWDRLVQACEYAGNTVQALQG